MADLRFLNIFNLYIVITVMCIKHIHIDYVVMSRVRGVRAVICLN